jgi:hypothetical protein
VAGIRLEADDRGTTADDDGTVVGSSDNGSITQRNREGSGGSQSLTTASSSHDHNLGEDTQADHGLNEDHSYHQRLVANRLGTVLDPDDGDPDDVDEESNEEDDDDIIEQLGRLALSRNNPEE